MTDLINILVGLLSVAGAIFVLSAAIGVLRFPNLYSRMHAASKAGVFGSGLILVGLALLAQDTTIASRAFLAVAFLILTTPISAHLLAKAAYFAGYPSLGRSGPPEYEMTIGDEGSDEKQS